MHPATIELRTLANGELAEAARLLAAAMADNPTHRAVFGERPAARVQRLQRFFRSVLPYLQARGSLVAALDRQGALVGLIGVLPPGCCRPAGASRLVLGLRLATTSRPDILLRTLRWLLAWQAGDPAAPHWHLGPLAVRRDRRRQGVGARLLQDALQRADAAGLACYLETDLPGNVAFYRRFGFEVVGQAQVLGMSNWFLQRG